MSAPRGWEGILAEGETVLWQGRPAPGVRLGDFVGFPLVFGLLFAGFAAVWIALARTAARGDVFDLFPLFGVPFLLIGLYLAFGLPFGRDYLRRRSWYTLTDRAAYIATEILGRRRLHAVPIDAMNILELEDDAPGTVLFRREIRTSRGIARGTGPTVSRHARAGVQDTGFERIAEARAVFRLIADRRRALDA